MLKIKSNSSSQISWNSLSEKTRKTLALFSKVSSPLCLTLTSEINDLVLSKRDF